MKIYTITIHFGTNYGSVLQAYALYHYLESQGHDVKVINYIPDRYSKNRYFDSSNIRTLLHSIAAFPFRVWYQMIFDKFLNSNLNLTPKYSTIEELSLKCGDRVVYIAGSDQIWNSSYNVIIDPAYYLEFAGINSRKFAYAGSFGKSKLDEWEKEETKRLLQNFNTISTRELQAKKIIKDLGIKDEVLHVLDPVFLLRKEEWLNFINKKKNRKPYVLVYALDKEERQLLQYAEIISKALNLEVAIICFEHTRKKYRDIDKCHIHKSPKDFVDLINNANFVVTNSFHGLAFSINLNKQFVAVKRKKFNSRLESLLELVDLKDRMIIDKLSNKLIIEKIDYNNCNNILDNERKKAYQYISNAIGDSDIKGELN